ncbi:hypothetical protein ES319_D05G365200v1 [Gossypium barbadense]|uniref:Uncharacterized protein n=2 Tax=Gossypium TaxID=3633 RepID=A0A5J5RLX1_GOSBA|nr:hypothetical protein ES319_D05G365200v1 [Gossypium barbadense]TYG71366.1 hypothetical protein ES288_D05G390400v1 [Gossypium darwinii]
MGQALKAKLVWKYFEGKVNIFNRSALAYLIKYTANSLYIVEIMQILFDLI